MKEISIKRTEIMYLKDFLIKNHFDDTEVGKKILKNIIHSSKVIKRRSAKSKGRNLQYWVCEKISKLLGLPFDQSDDNCLIHSREMGLNGKDIILRGEAGERFKYDIECKAQETLSIPQWIEQAQSNVEEGHDWLLVFKKKTMGEPMVVMTWDAFERTFNNK